MADCIICGKPAGIFRTSHPACLAAAAAQATSQRDGWSQRMVDEMAKPAPDIAAVIAACAQEMGAAAVPGIAAAALSMAVNGFIARGERPTLEQLDPLANLNALAHVDYHTVPDRGFVRFVMLVTLADLVAGKFPDRCDDPQLGFMYERGERIAWVCGAEYWRDEVQHGRGIYAGMSMRVMPGLYARAGQYHAGATVEGMVPIAEGNLVITDRALWFQGPHGVQRTFLQDLISIQCFDDGFGFCARGNNSRNEMYKTGAGEGWFAHALVTELAQGISPAA